MPNRKRGKIVTVQGIRWRAAVVITLGLLPLVFLAGVGAYHLWERGWSFTAWVPMAACFLTAYALAWFWSRQRIPGDTLGLEPPPDYWTDRDQTAWALVTEHAQAAAKLTPDQITDFDRYAHDAKELALKIARVYHPESDEPFGHLTIPEILTCSELVTQDMAVLVEKYLPMSHVLRVDDWMQARNLLEQASIWYPRLRAAYWVGSALFAPFRTAIQAAVTHGGMSPLFAQVQRNVMQWLLTVYVHKLGRYLIELNSGRLRVGTQRYRELLAQHRIPTTLPDGSADAEAPDLAMPNAESPPTTTETATPVATLTVAVIGPVKAGKSSLINALLGEQQAATDVVPLTAQVTQYQLHQPGLPALTFLDTAGFGNDGPRDADLETALRAAQEADILILATPARSAARVQDVAFLQKLRERFTALPHQKLPPIVVSLTQMDKLTPAVEWNPPYDWETGTRTKEQSIREAVAAAREQFGSMVAAIVPVCAAVGKEQGVREDLLGTLAGLLGEGRGVALLRTLHVEATANRTRRAFSQFVNLGKEAWQALVFGNASVDAQFRP
ncbi:MAG: 50S ribosome-binding GTPase [Bacteroidales bacterium]|nr:50S ribosome-binding GTPase [Bacteroidales bacterium]